MSAPEIMKREWRRMPPMLSGGAGAGGIVANVLALLFVAGLLPLVMGVAFLEPGPLIAFASLSVFFVTSIVTGCFAGEVARRDMRELAASGVSDSAILLGKAGAAALRGWALGMAVVVVGVITVNLANWSGRALLPDRMVSGKAITLSLAASLLAALAGALISLGAPSARLAHRNQKIAIVLAVLVSIDAVWFYPGDLLQVANLAWIVLGLLVIGSSIVFRSLRKRMLAATVAGS
jgi:ABC-2 type transport system permease protein